MKLKQNTAIILLFIVAIIWGTGFPVSQIALDQGLAPFHILVYRFTIAAIVLTVVFFKRVKANFKKELIPGTIVGIFLFLGFFFQTTGLEHTTPSINAFLTALNVIIAPFLFWIITKEKIDRYVLIGAFLALIGIGFLTIDGELKINIGDLLTITCAFFFACHIVSVGYFTMKKNSDVITLVVIQIIISAILSIVGSLIFDPIKALPTTEGFMSVLYLGLFSTLLCFFMQNIAQKFVDSTKTAIILTTESVWGTIFSVILVGEVLTPKIAIGAVIVFIAIIITETKLKFLKKEV